MMERDRNTLCMSFIKTEKEGYHIHLMSFIKSKKERGIPYLYYVLYRVNEIPYSSYALRMEDGISSILYR